MDNKWHEIHQSLNNRSKSKTKAKTLPIVLPRIEIHAVDHCVQKCQHCSHAADIAPKATYNPSDYDHLFQNIYNHGIRWQFISILGGEPFINPNLLALIEMCKKYTNNVEVMTNLFWLKTPESIDENEEILNTLDRLTITYYRPIFRKNGGRKTVLNLVEQIKEKHPNLHIHQFGPKNAVVRHFAKMEFHEESKPTINEDCNMRGCKQLMHTGELLGCCAARRVPDYPAVDKFRIDTKFDPMELNDWYTKPMLDLCNHCSIATEGIKRQLWQLIE